jgi:hypothetical protein
MMVPSDHQTDIAPDAGVSGVNAFINSIKCTFTYDVVATPPVGQESVGANVYAQWTDCVPFTNGLYLSLPQESHESVWHMGFVAPGSFFGVNNAAYQLFPLSAAARGFDIRPHYVGPQMLVAGPIGNAGYPTYYLKYIGELALPRVGPNVGITFATSVSQNYSKVRAFAADFKISSTTISGSNFNMAGVFTSGVIADTRNISQVNTDQSAVRQAYPAALLNAQSITRPDDLSGVEVMKGAIDIMGPDYPRQWCSVDVDATDTIQAQWQQFQYVVPTSPVLSAVSASTALANGAYNVAQLWVCSTDTEFFISNYTNTTNVPVGWQKFYAGAINEDGMLDIDVSVRANIAIGAPAAAAGRSCQYDYVVNFIHVFAFVRADGLVQYNMASQTDRFPITTTQSLNQLALFNNGQAGTAALGTTTQIPNQPAYIAKCRPRMQRTGMALSTGGKYLGTLVTLSMQFNSQDTAADTYSVYAFGGTIRVRGRNVDSPGRVGPAHCIRYDGLGVGQQMSFAGTTWLQGIALGQLAPFINTNGATLTVPDNIFSKFVELLWAMSPKYRRILSLAEYNQYVKPYFRDLTLGDLMASIERLDGQTASVAKSLGVSGGWFPGASEARGKMQGALAGLGGHGGGGRLRDLILAAEESDYDAPSSMYRASRAQGEAGGQYPVVQESNNARYIDLYNPGSGSAGGAYRRQRGQ